MQDLKPHQLELLQFLVARNSPAPPASLDGRNLRPLKAQGLVVELGSGVVPTETGRAHVAQVSRDDLGRTGVIPRPSLSELQEELVRYLLRQSGPVPADHLDGRVLRALRKQGLITEEAGCVSPSPEAQSRLPTRVAGRRPSRQANTGATAGARAEAILKAVERLDAALPRDIELMIGDLPANADDVLKALRVLARKLESAPTSVRM